MPGKQWHAILLLHLTLYPYPDITKVVNPYG
jgi:hypothetical protein